MVHLILGLTFGSTVYMADEIAQLDGKYKHVEIRCASGGPNPDQYGTPWTKFFSELNDGYKKFRDDEPELEINSGRMIKRVAETNLYLVKKNGLEWTFPTFYYESIGQIEMLTSGHFVVLNSELRCHAIEPAEKCLENCKATLRLDEPWLFSKDELAFRNKVCSDAMKTRVLPQGYSDRLDGRTKVIDPYRSYSFDGTNLEVYFEMRGQYYDSMCLTPGSSLEDGRLVHRFVKMD